MNNDRKCGNCLHYYEGVCRRFPPNIPVHGISQLHYVFPTVAPHLLCGEYERQGGTAELVEVKPSHIATGDPKSPVENCLAKAFREVTNENCSVIEKEKGKWAFETRWGELQFRDTLNEWYNEWLKDQTGNSTFIMKVYWTGGRAEHYAWTKVEMNV